MRMWGHTITPGHALHNGPGDYREDIFNAFDFVLDEAKKRGLKVVIVLADNWYDTGGVMNYVKWVKGDKGTREDFYTNGM